MGYRIRQAVFLVLLTNTVYLVKSKIPPDVLEIASMTTPKIIEKYGYPVESHYVTTEDGYNLAMHRIKRQGARPFFLQHGLLDSSVTFVLMGPKISLGYLLWELGHDVWMGNARGNRYSRNHTTLNPNQKEFWQFSWNEIGYYDLPAMIDYILNVTQFKKIFYVGHSQGTTSFFVMCSTRPSYNQKIALMQALAPVAFMSHIKTPIYRLLKRVAEATIRALGEYEFLPNGKLQDMCFQENPRALKAMIDGFFLLMGRNDKELNKTMWPAICRHLPAGAATNQVIHYLQLIRSGRFSKYDFGLRKNQEKYAARIPPKYDLSKVSAPVALYYSDNDYLTASVDVEHLASLLPNVVESYKVPDPDFNHMDFVWAIHVRDLLYERLLERAEKANLIF